MFLSFFRKTLLFSKILKNAWAGSSVVECLPRTQEAPGANPGRSTFAYVCLSKTKVSVELFSSFFKRIAGNGRGIILK